MDTGDAIDQAIVRLEEEFAPRLLKVWEDAVDRFVASNPVLVSQGVRAPLVSLAHRVHRLSPGRRPVPNCPAPGELFDETWFENEFQVDAVPFTWGDLSAAWTPTCRVGVLLAEECDLFVAAQRTEAARLARSVAGFVETCRVQLTEEVGPWFDLDEEIQDWVGRQVSGIMDRVAVRTFTRRLVLPRGVTQRWTVPQRPSGTTRTTRTRPGCR